MAAILGTLDLDDDKAAVFVQTKEIDPSVAIFPITVFFGNHHQFSPERSNVVAKQPLEILSFEQALSSEGGSRNRFEFLRGYAVQAHGGDGGWLRGVMDQVEATRLCRGPFRSLGARDRRKEAGLSSGLQ